VDDGDYLAMPGSFGHMLPNTPRPRRPGPQQTNRDRETIGMDPPTGERRAMLRAAVIQVVRHLVLREVPPAQRVPLFDQATSLLDESGWGLDELAAAAEPGPAQDALLRALRLDGDAP
jgi:hypothetical protein